MSERERTERVGNGTERRLLHVLGKDPAADPCLSADCRDLVDLVPQSLIRSQDHLLDIVKQGQGLNVMPVSQHFNAAYLFGEFLLGIIDEAHDSVRAVVRPAQGGERP
jgi:hypothetical protein